MAVIFAVIAICLVQSSVADEQCKTGTVWPHPTNPIYYYKCLAPGVEVQLKCPPGEYFANGERKCIIGTPPVEPTEKPGGEGGGSEEGGEPEPPGGGESGGEEPEPPGGGESGGEEPEPPGGGESGGEEPEPPGGGESGGEEPEPPGGGESGGEEPEPPGGGESGAGGGIPTEPPRPPTDESGNGSGSGSGGEGGGIPTEPPRPPIDDDQ